MLLLQKNKKYISFTNFTTSNHNKCLKLLIIPTYICFNTVLQLFNLQKITSLLPEPDNASPVYENTPSFITPNYS
jgi:hypothetical protein